MKITKNKLTQGDYGSELVDDKEQRKYLRQTAYWVGNFVFEFNDLENTVTRIIAEHIDGRLEKNEYAYVFLTGLMFNQKVEMLERYYNFHLAVFAHKNLGNIIKRKNEIISELKTVGKNRNTIVHANYYSLDINGNIREKTKFAGADVEEHWVSINRDFLVESINQVIDLIEKSEEFDEDFTGEIFS